MVICGYILIKTIYNTYSDLFQFVIMLCAVITLVAYFTHKK